MKDEIIQLLMNDSDSLIRFYKAEVDRDHAEFETLKGRMDELFAAISKKNEIISSLESMKKNSPEESENLQGLSIKWRSVILDHFNSNPAPAASNEVADSISDRLNLISPAVRKQVRDKVAITLSGMFRDARIWRVRDETSGYKYLIKVEQQAEGLFKN